MKYFVIGLLTLLLGACTQQDAQVRQVLNSVCPSVEVAYAHYQAVSVLVSDRTKAKVELAKQQADMLCAGRENATTVTILAVGSMVYANVRDALKEAKANKESFAYSGTINKLEGILKKARKAY